MFAITKAKYTHHFFKLLVEWCSLLSFLLEQGMLRKCMKYTQYGVLFNSHILCVYKGIMLIKVCEHTSKTIISDLVSRFGANCTL